MKNGGEQWQVDDDLLTETGRGGLFTDGYLQGEPLVSYFDSTETPLFVFGSGKRGVTRIEGEQTDRMVPASGYRAVTALTDRRIQFVVGGGDNDGDWAADIRLADVDRVTVDEGLIRSQLTVYADGVEWKVHLKDVSTERVVTFLEDVSWAWIQVEELIGDARKHLVDATQHHKSREYDAAHASLARARSKLDEASEVADTLAEEASTGIRERITQIESRYRETKRRTHATQATHLVDEAERHWRNEHYARSYEAFAQARHEYETVLDIYGLEPDKAEAMRDRIEHVEHNLQALAGAPLEHANEAREQALAADSTQARLKHWSESLEKYRTVIELDWGKDHKRFEGDLDLLRDRAAESVEGILDARRALADECQERGDEHIAADEISEARGAFSDAMEHLEHAQELAHEFDPDACDDIERRLEMLGECISNATASVSMAYESTEDSETDSFDSDSVTVDAFEPLEPSDEEEETGDDAYDDFDNWVTLSPDDDQEDDADEADDEDLVEVETADEDFWGEPPSTETDESPPAESEADETAGSEPSPTGPLADRLQDVELPLADAPDEAADPDQETITAVKQLHSRALTEVVESMWNAMGWSVTVTDDLIEVSREDPEPMSKVVTVVAEEDVTVADVDQCLVARDTRNTDSATLVASSPVDSNAERRASEAGVEILDASGLAALIEREDLHSVLPDATA